MITRSRIRKLTRFLVGGGATLCLVVGLLLPALPVSANGVTVSVDAPATVAPGDYFTADIDVSTVTLFDSANFDVMFNTGVLEIENPASDVTDGKIGTTTVPVVSASEISAGVVRVVVNVGGYAGVTGSGYLCQIRFHATGASGTSSNINLQNGTLAAATMPPSEILATWTGTTVNVVLLDTTAPTVAGFPTGYNVPINILVTATFSEAMNAATITTASFTLTGSPVPGTVTYDAGTHIATFDPTEVLDYGHRYTAALSTAITDAAGNPLARTYSWSFTTVEAPHLELAKSVSPSTIGQKGSGIRPEETTVTLTVSGAGEPGEVAGEDIVVTDVLQSYINLEDEPDDATITHNADGTTTLVWELEDPLSTTDDPWTVSFDISSDKCGKVLANVVDKSKVTYTDYEDGDAEAFFPATYLNVRCPGEVAVGVLPPEPAKIGASYLYISPEQIVPSQWVEISANIYNRGGTKATHTVALYINGYLAQSQAVGVSPGGTELVVFRVRADSEFLGGIYTGPGEYIANVEGMEGQFFVLAPAVAAPAGFGGPLGTAGIIAIVVVVIVLIVGLVFGLKRE